MTKVNKKYDANFTAEGILHHEFITLFEILKSANFKELLKIEVEQNNLMGVAVASSRKRIVSELKRRNNNVPNNVLYTQNAFKYVKF